MSTMTRLGLTDHQREQRRGKLTASDVAAWMGLHPFKSAADVFLEKTGRVPEPETGEAAEIGQRVEPYLLDWAAERLGCRITKNQWRTGGHPVLGATLDAITEDGRPLEAKTVGMANFHALRLDQWGEDGTDIVPDQFLIQVTTQMIVSGANEAHLAALLAGYGQRLYSIERHPAVVEAILAAADSFAACLKTDTPPANSTPSLEVIQSARRASGRCVTVRDDIAAAYVEANRARKAAEEVEEAARAELLAAMRDADGEYVDEARWSAGSITYRQNKPGRRCDYPAMAAAHPVIAQQYMREWPGARVLRVKEGGWQ